ncbi:MAG: hypothetical protein DCF19_19960 [Pseudanabaena frigida]|uniref:Type I restriction modification DNA specificity domain-containing protein n=1 Tax=Pseudanabaena frigida TaxID=945775 RepID=A0A2W4VVV7_9CYAN|nr:MAG: hypothetical protein DCF19_19960 [Pseudanabaena frigida]
MVSMSSDFSILSDNDDLPMGWVITELENVCTVQGGYAFKSKDYTENGIPLVRISNLVENNNVDLDSNPIFLPESYRISHSNYCLREGDILIAMSGATTGKMAVFRCSLDALLNQRVGRFIIRDKTLVDKPYLSKLIENLSSKVAQKAYGGAQPNISPSEIERLLIPLPPLNEQRRIVEKVEALMARSRKAKEALDAIPKLIEQFRQSVLAAAFRGDLTADWREQNPNIEPTSVLLERISRGLNLEIERSIDKEKYFPESWRLTKLGTCIKKIQAGKNFTCPEMPVNDNTIGLVKISAVTWGKFNPQETKTVDDPQKVDPKLFINRGDFLISRANTLELVGASVIVEEISHKIMLSDKIWRIEFAEIDKRYVNWYLKSSLGRAEIESRATGNQLSMRNISQDSFREILIPIPPISEQIKIVSFIDSQFDVLERLKHQYQSILKNFSNLDQSILSKAFRGELVEQDPNDEPASVLLERIQKERAKEKTIGKSKNKKEKAVNVEIPNLFS